MRSSPITGGGRGRGRGRPAQGSPGCLAVLPWQRDDSDKVSYPASLRQEQREQFGQCPQVELCPGEGQSLTEHRSPLLARREADSALEQGGFRKPTNRGRRPCVSDHLLAYGIPRHEFLINIPACGSSPPTPLKSERPYDEPSEGRAKTLPLYILRWRLRPGNGTAARSKDTTSVWSSRRPWLAGVTPNCQYSQRRHFFGNFVSGGGTSGLHGCWLRNRRDQTQPRARPAADVWTIQGIELATNTEG